MSGRTRDRIHRNVFAKGLGMFGVIIFFRSVCVPIYSSSTQRVCNVAFLKGGSWKNFNRLKILKIWKNCSNVRLWENHSNLLKLTLALNANAERTAENVGLNGISDSAVFEKLKFPFPSHPSKPLISFSFL
jgi:hypothetical protein